MSWNTQLKPGDKLIIGGCTVITVERKTSVVIDTVAGTTQQRIEKIEADKPAPVTDWEDVEQLTNIRPL